MPTNACPLIDSRREADACPTLVSPWGPRAETLQPICPTLFGEQGLWLL